MGAPSGAAEGPVGPSRLGLAEAAGELLDRLEGVVHSRGVILAVHFSSRRVARLLDHQIHDIIAPDVQYLLQALVQEQVLAPLAGPAVAPVVDVLDALGAVLRERRDGVGGEHLDGAVQAIPAIVDVHPARLLHLAVQRQGVPQPPGEEDRVRVHLDRPGIVRIRGVVDDSVPNLQEHPRVQGRPELSAHDGLEVAVHLQRLHARGNLEDAAAVDRALLAAENASVARLLEPDQTWLVAGRHAQAPAEQGGSLNCRRDRSARVA
mmetsp:Transcript_43873/g.114088  ORF Transcript_43873/g.114088 Transcript_43873/m.114088 type:complete len:264 (+) Transcript_43873:308-1099(+)